MLKDTILGLVVALIVISSVAWVSQFRRIREKIRLRKAIQAAHHPVKQADSPDRFAA
jgi:hypothetical protein